MIPAETLHSEKMFWFEGISETALTKKQHTSYQNSVKYFCQYFRGGRSSLTQIWGKLKLSADIAMTAQVFHLCEGPDMSKPATDTWWHLLTRQTIFWSCSIFFSKVIKKKKCSKEFVCGFFPQRIWENIFVEPNKWHILHLRVTRRLKRCSWRQWCRHSDSACSRSRDVTWLAHHNKQQQQQWLTCNYNN